MAISLSPAERETVMQVDEETMEWIIWTCQRRVMTRLNNGGWEPYNTHEEDGRVIIAEYKIPFNAITFRSETAVNTKRELSPGHLAALQAGQKAQMDSTP